MMIDKRSYGISIGTSVLSPANKCNRVERTRSREKTNRAHAHLIISSIRFVTSEAATTLAWVLPQHVLTRTAHRSCYIGRSIHYIIAWRRWVGVTMHTCTRNAKHFLLPCVQMPVSEISTWLINLATVKPGSVEGVFFVITNIVYLQFMTVFII